MNPLQKFFKKKEWAYRTLFQRQDAPEINIAAKHVIADLRTFCHGTKTSFSQCPYETARAEGRREVFTRVMNFLNIDYSNFYDYEEELDE